MYLYVSKFQVVNDHKPLLPDYNKRKPGPKRVERHNLRLHGFNFGMILEQGSTNLADYTSRHPVPLDTQAGTMAEQGLDDDDEVVVNRIVHYSLTLEQVRKATEADPVLSTVKQHINEHRHVWSAMLPACTTYQNQCW